MRKRPDECFKQKRKQLAVCRARRKADKYAKNWRNYSDLER